MTTTGSQRLFGWFGTEVSGPIRGLVTSMVRKGVATSLMSQGIAAHAPEDIARREREDWDTVAAVLGGTPYAPGYLGGRGPCAEDCTLFAALDSCLNTPFPGEGKRHLLARHPTLVAYADALRARFFPDKGPVVAAVRERSELIAE